VFLPHDASAEHGYFSCNKLADRLSVHPYVTLRYPASHRLEYFENKFTAD